jgi:selenide,water dikinase
LAVVGYVHPEKIITNAASQPGDLLVLTKPVGMGIIMAGQRLGMATEADVNEAKRLMKLLNKSGAEIMKKNHIKCATDITGFGLAGHAMKMAKASKVSIKIEMKKVPLIGNSYNLVDDGCIPGASFRNLEFVEEHLFEYPSLDYNLKMIAFDAQTSGGLLMCVSPYSVESVLKDLRAAGLTTSAIIGEVTGLKGKYLSLES